MRGVTRDPTPFEAIPSRPNPAGAVLGIALALLIALLPGAAPQGSRLQSAFSATTLEQALVVASDRAGDSRRSLQNAKGPNPRRPHYGDAPALLAASIVRTRIAPQAASPRPALSQAQPPGRWPSTARARAPPLA